MTSVACLDMPPLKGLAEPTRDPLCSLFRFQQHRKIGYQFELSSHGWPFPYVPYICSGIDSDGATG
jgi:hypothetical protein